MRNKFQKTTLKGQIERITYSNSENGYTIAKLKVFDQSELVTAVGNAPDLSPGQLVTLEGEWTRHPKYGDLFKILRFQIEHTSSHYGIEKYLGSGLIKGIGPKRAKKLVKKYGKNTIDIVVKEQEGWTKEKDDEFAAKHESSVKSRKIAVNALLKQLEKVRKDGGSWEEQKDIIKAIEYLGVDFRDKEHPRHIHSEVKREVWLRDNGQCQSCGSRNDLQFDHIIPFSLGGSSTEENIQLLCKCCNEKKSNSIE